jgi:hypothetical protein
MAMANFQIGHSKLFPDGAQLFANGKSGEEKLVLHHDNTIQLELAGMDLTSPPVLTANPVNIIHVTAPKKVGNKWVFTVDPVGNGRVSLSAADSKGTAAPDLTVIAGVFKNHKDAKGELEEDLIADVYRGHDSAKMHTIIRILGNDADNLANENSVANVKQWGPLACGTVAKVTGRELFYRPIDYDYRQYYKTIAPKTENGRQVWKITDRSEVKYDSAKLSQGEKAIQARLKKGQPAIVGITYIPSDAITPGGSLRETGSGGHTVLIIGCDKDAKRFLYFDPYGPDAANTNDSHGSNLQYLGGMDGLNTFPGKCRYLGMFEEIDEPARGGPVLRQDPATIDPVGLWTGKQFLEVVSGPLR